MMLINELLIRPLFNILMLLVSGFGWSMWWGIIILTLLIRFALYKNSAQTLQMQQGMGQNQWNMQKKMEDIQKKYANDPKRMQKETMALLKKDWWWMLKWCKAMLLQLPVFLGLYGVISSFANFANPDAAKSRFSFNIPYSEQIYSFLTDIVWKYLDVANNVDTIFYGINLLEPKNIILAILAGWLMVINMYITSSLKPMKTQSIPGMWWKWAPDVTKMMQPMMYGMAVFMWIITYSLTAGVWLYMVTTTLFSVWQAIWTNKEIIKVKYKAKFRKKWEWEIIDVK